jgi:hypothetical protein
MAVDGTRKPISVLKRVDLPEPLTPTSAQIDAGPSTKLASRIAVTPLL